jgi:hypothetical protein
VPVPGWKSRTELRNTSFVQLLLSSGLRRQEGCSLLTFELPSQRLQFGRYCHGRVAATVTRSKQSRVFYVPVDAVGQAEEFVESERAWAVQRAQVEGRYERLPMMLLVTKVTRSLRPKVEWVDRNGVVGERELSRLGWRERQWLFLEGPDGSDHVPWAPAASGNRRRASSRAPSARTPTTQTPIPPIRAPSRPRRSRPTMRKFSAVTGKATVGGLGAGGGCCAHGPDVVGATLPSGAGVRGRGPGWSAR